MALIDVTIENPSLVNTGGEGSQTTASSSGTDSEDGDVDPEAEFEETGNKSRALQRAAEGASRFVRGNN